MQRIKHAALAVMAVFALSILVAAPAMAAQPELLPGSGTLTVKSGEGKLVKGNGEEIKCKSDKGSGTVTSTTKGTFTVDFEGCTGLSGFVACNSLGDASGVILSGGSSELRFISLSTEAGGLVAGILFKPETTHVLCGFVLINVTGSFVCPIAPINKKVKTTEHETVTCSQSKAGEQNPTSVFNAAGTAKETVSLESSQNEGTAEKSSETTTEEVSDSLESEIMG